MKKPNRLKRILIFLLIMLTSAFVGLNTTMAIPIEQTNWDVVYDSGNVNHPGSIYSGATYQRNVSLATRSNGYPAIVFSKNSTRGLGYAECTSGDCASGDGVGNWSPYTTINSSTNINYAKIDFNTNDEPVIFYTDGNNLKIATYINSAWRFSSGSFVSFYNADFDFIIDGNNNYYLVFDDGSNPRVAVAVCQTYNTTNCDDPGDYSKLDLYSVGGNSHHSLDIDSSGYLHLVYGEYNGYYIKYSKCDINTGCNASGEWSTVYNVVSTSSYVSQIPNMSLDAQTSTLGFAYNGASEYLKYVEYVGSGGNCDNSWGGAAGADAWNCSNVSSSNISIDSNGDGRYAFELDIYSATGERGIAVGSPSGNPNMRYVSCTSNCTTNSNWTAEPIFVNNGTPTNIYSGSLISMEFGSGPRIASSTSGSLYVYYAEQEGDLPPEEQIVPELPQSSIWKIAIAVLAFGLVIGIVAWRNKKKK